MKKEVLLMPKTKKYLKMMGEQIKTARLRRNLSAQLIADRAGVSRATVWQIEKGSGSVSMGAYAAVLHALNGMDIDLLLIAKDDQLGKTIQDLHIITRNRGTNK